jgi:hypothetical protein
MMIKKILSLTLLLMTTACAIATPTPLPTFAIVPTVAPTATVLPTLPPTPSATLELASTLVELPTATTLPPTPTLSPTPAISTSGVPFVRIEVSAKAKEIYQKGIKLGNNGKAFSKVGDCMSTYPFFMVPFDSPKQYKFPNDLSYLQETITQFNGSFGRASVAARDGFSGASLFNPQWSDEKLCKSTEDPLGCELRLNRPSIVIISLGTNGIWLTAEQHEGYMRNLIIALSSRGVLPILSTKADNVEGDGRFNKVTLKLAKEYELPLWDYYSLAQVLPKSGITDGQYHMDWAPPLLDEGLKTGWQLRNISALQALDSVWRGVR